MTSVLPASDALSRLSAHGVSLWLDDLSRGLIRSGRLAELVATRNIVGVTTNPTIFQAAMSDGPAYREQLTALAAAGASVDDTVRQITTDDVREAADVLAPVFDATGGVDGRVSLEVDPRLADDSEATIKQALELARLVDRPNLMIKIPATLAGLPAITSVIAEGISVNVTLIFSAQRYAQVMEAYFAGLESAHANGRDVSTIHSVASFFISRVDTEIDRQLKEIGSAEATALLGRAAIANARLAYQLYEETFATRRWADLAAVGANKQRPLWASTGVKDPAYDPARYVTEIVAAGTVNTAPLATIDAVASQGTIAGDTITPNYSSAAEDMESLAALGIALPDVFELLEKQAVAKFEQSWEALLGEVRKNLTVPQSRAPERH
ncbi:transaldolase [Hoyosella subflava]|uniref:Transaldolase n=1 Tax=Hoyosella subflava (strain DSM 45089 / JCM 17490 / NBRC 109087 / DQS3-9A1) TaxID=443218 RepID=F6EQJ7_HOYSD|nr:transaldolase [Hoyosella subflava]AEF41874.1 Transaldolase [Hoyosella subflava DQS3-9A1]